MTMTFRKFAEKHTPTVTFIGLCLVAASYYFVTRAFADATYAQKDDVTEMKAMLKATSENVIAICTVTPSARCK